MRSASFSVAALLVWAVGCGSDDDPCTRATGGWTNNGVGGIGGYSAELGGTGILGGSRTNTPATTSTRRVADSSGGAAASGGALSTTGGSSNVTGTQATLATTLAAGQSSVAGTGGNSATVPSSNTGGTTSMVGSTNAAATGGSGGDATGVGGVQAATGGAAAAASATGGTSASSSTGGVSGVLTGAGGASTGGADSGGSSGIGVAETGGTSASGGTTATGGTPTEGGTSGTGGTSAAGVPADWTCADSHYASGDGCDCGCGHLDPDCASVLALCEDAHSRKCCETFLQTGSCAALMSTGWPALAIDPADNAKCVNAPPVGWVCAPSAYGDGTCDCGCGVVDVLDCANDASCTCASPGSCAFVDSNCDYIDPQNHESCDRAPAGWHCPQDYYQDGEHCDCGCGLADPDCAGVEGVNDCECSSYSCSEDCNEVSADNLAVCTAWSCESWRRSNGICDCGCGDDGADCATQTGVAVCMTCAAAGSCATSCDDIDPTNNTQCGE